MHLKYISSTRIFSSRFTKIFLLFCACAFIGSSIGKIVSHNTARQTAASAQSSNWGLSFQEEVTRRFVQTVVNDQIPESILSLVKEQKEHFRVERLKFIGSSVKRPVISDICHVDGIVVNILGATVQELQENVMCVFILQLIGTEEKILEAEKQIDENGVIRERVEAI